MSPVRIALYFLLLAAVVVVAWWRGRTDERVAALTCLAGTLLTVLTNHPLSTRYLSFNAASFLVDLGVLIAFGVLALRSDRYWPMWVAGLQLTATSVHLLKLIDPDLMRFVFGAALAFWSYPILLVIIAGALRTRMIERWRSVQRLPEAA